MHKEILAESCRFGLMMIKRRGDVDLSSYRSVCKFSNRSAKTNRIIPRLILPIASMGQSLTIDEIIAFSINPAHLVHFPSTSNWEYLRDKDTSGRRSFASIAILRNVEMLLHQLLAPNLGLISSSKANGSKSSRTWRGSFRRWRLRWRWRRRPHPAPPLSARCSSSGRERDLKRLDEIRHCDVDPAPVIGSNLSLDGSPLNHRKIATGDREALGTCAMNARKC